MDLAGELPRIKLDDRVVGRIDHSVKFVDDAFEFRYVLLPRCHPILDMAEHFRSRPLLEHEWRALGIKQTRGWEHFGYSPHESNALLFRRILGTDARTGRPTAAAEEVARNRLIELSSLQIKHDMMAHNHLRLLADGPTHFRDATVDNVMEADDDNEDYIATRCSTAVSPPRETALIDAVPVFGSQQQWGGLDAVSQLAPDSPLRSGGIAAAQNSKMAVTATTARLIAAALRRFGPQFTKTVYQVGTSIESNLSEEILEQDWFNFRGDGVNTNPPIKETTNMTTDFLTEEEVLLMNDVDYLYAEKMLPIL